MMSGDFYFRDKIPVAILGATGAVGQKFIQLLEKHPWFRIAHLCASERSVGKRYQDAVHWLMETPLQREIGEMIVQPCHPPFSCQLLFSALDASVAGEIESACAHAGAIVVSNARNHRMDPTVPLVIGEVNPEHLELAAQQSFGKGMIVTNPNCAVIGLTLALKPIFDQFGLEAVQVVTMQAISGAGYPGVPGPDILDNIIPYIAGEEEKIETEPLKILGTLHSHAIVPASFSISAQCNRVPVRDGHLAAVSVKLKESAESKQLIAAWEHFSGEPQALQLPTAPEHPLYYLEHSHAPQPKLHRNWDKEMAVTIGRLKAGPLFDYSFTLLSHNMTRGAAGAALLNAELLVRKGWVYW